MAKLFLDGIFSNSSYSPSTIYISMPNMPQSSFLKSNPEGGSILRGLLISEPSFSAQNKWGPVINDITNLQDVASLIGSNSMFSWINASTMCWKGTSPLTVSVEFYLINYKRGLGIEEGLKNLVKMCSLDQDPNATVGQNFKVQVHGGYAADILTGNKRYFDTGNNLEKFIDENSKGAAAINTLHDELYSNGDALGSIKLQFGRKSIIKNLLLSKISVTESIVEVADQGGNDRRPLYYRVSAQFTGVRPLLTVDVDDMYSIVSGGREAGYGNYTAPTTEAPPNITRRAVSDNSSFSGGKGTSGNFSGGTFDSEGSRSSSGTAGSW